MWEDEAGGSGDSEDEFGALDRRQAVRALPKPEYSGARRNHTSHTHRPHEGVRGEGLTPRL